MKDIQIHRKTIIGEHTPAYIIAEMSANHAGNMERAKEIIYAAKEAGADCIKLQTYTPDTITMDCDNEYFQIKSGTWKNENLYQLYGKAYTPWEWQPELKAVADEIGIDFLSTPFDATAVDFLEELNLDFYKIASFEIVDIPLIEYVASKGKPIIMSTGMASLSEIEMAVNTVRNAGNEQIVLLRCASAYPAITDEMNLRTMQNMKETFDVQVGLSDHSGGSVGAVTAVALGAKVIEKHFCISRTIENPDASFSMEPEEFRRMVQDIRQSERAIGTVKYGVSKQEQENLRFRKSIFAVQEIKKGEQLTPENIKVIRPGAGMSPCFYHKVLGAYALEDIPRGTPLCEEVLGKRACYLRKVKWEDMDLLYAWANDKEVRQNSFSSEPIAYPIHQKWFREKMQEENSHLFILCQEQQNIGMLRLDMEGKKAVISYSIAAEYRNMSYGEKLIFLAEQKVRQSFPEIELLMAKVKADNQASNRIFVKSGYEKKEEQRTEDGKHEIQYEKRMPEEA